jgi:glutamate--cysteine ligase catalytic subunit
LFFQCDKFPGLITIINRYLESINIDVESRCILGKYLEFVKKKAKGNFKIYLQQLPYNILI